MVEIIVAVFDSEQQADLVENDLQAGGVPQTMIRRYAPGDADAPQTTGVPPEPEGGFFSWLFGGIGMVAHEDQGIFEEHLDHGRTIISVHIVDRVQGSEVMRILESRAPSEIEAQTTETDPPATAPTAVPMVEKQLDSAKRGGMNETRIRRYVVTDPKSRNIID